MIKDSKEPMMQLLHAIESWYAGVSAVLKQIKKFPENSGIDGQIVTIPLFPPFNIDQKLKEKLTETFPSLGEKKNLALIVKCMNRAKVHAETILMAWTVEQAKNHPDKVI